MFHDAPNVNYLFAELLVEELVRHGVEWFVISPGSRSAPLAWTVASHPGAKHVVHFDERGAAFHALGIAKATLKPAAFICTSGTAAGNALPAAVEASYSGIPLVLITADRPEHLQGSGANQTINQHGLYREFIRHESNFAVDPANLDPVAVLIEIDRAVAAATAPWPGPVHLNCQMDEPLAPITPGETAFQSHRALTPVTEWTESGRPYSTQSAPRNDSRSERVALRGILSRRDGLVVVGQLSSPAERDAVRDALDRLGWLYIPDITSGLRLGPPSNRAMPFALHYADELFDRARTLMHVGGPVTSRRLLDPIARFDTTRDGREFVRISASPEKLDPHHNVTLRVHAAPETLKELVENASHEPNGDGAGDIDRRIYQVISRTMGATDPATEIGAVVALTFEPEQRWVLFAGNSMPIRDLDAYGLFNLNHPVWVVANRGASGIDGNIATAAGHARARGEPVIALLGDLAILHDLNSLALLQDLPAPVVLVAMNNDGGGIFSFLPIAKHPEHFERLFGTPHGIGFAQAAAMFGLDYFRPRTNMDIALRATEALLHRRSCIIEVISNRTENLRVHRELDAKIRAVLDTA